ncbi:hypothetical protein [Chitinophaga sp.]|uniref:hypothetical protein n=1 Tax=Chitinophaga sp. TaxID=1869181 RepID=UPI0031D01730
MARPIKETPVLKGKEAAKFLAEVNRSKNEKVSKETLEQIKKNFEKLKAIANF